ncbi:hypothetical protein GCM10010885_01600 [Alicyclobacillus cellulosilyticus]|uniref:Uncharacterized protein n=1 Tax=Alicyclobacillus cellulosilyticus TaxID=1003997 RepID=A0A917K2Z2_9BACL|nr:hypothetical protein [Alicyclobacillus cellulosilyticus]GGI95626.1 hypothetical protein GCM10010885_01600 [Alicyclobacillus cellulosilyticus]
MQTWVRRVRWVLMVIGLAWLMATGWRILTGNAPRNPYAPPQGGASTPVAGRGPETFAAELAQGVWSGIEAFWRVGSF